MKIAQLMRLEKSIAAGTAADIRDRWRWGLQVLADEEKIAPAGGLRHGVAATLIAEAAKRGLRLSDREIRYRLQCARAYPTEAQIGSASSDFGTWTDLREANFPTYAAPPGEPPADPRTDAERAHDRARLLAEMTDPQGSLFPLDRFEPTEATLKDLTDYAGEQADITARFAARDAERRDYLAQLVNAVGGDMTCTWQQAHEMWAAAA